jgi:hypothetical protein
MLKNSGTSSGTAGRFRTFPPAAEKYLSSRSSKWNCCKAAFVASGFIILKDKWESHGVFYAFCSTF